jgi:hypothetical protein
VIADLFVAGCARTSSKSNQYKVKLINQGFGFAYNVTSEIVNPPRFMRVRQALAHFVHPDDLKPDLLATMMPLSTLISKDTVSFTGPGDRREEDDGDDEGNGDEGNGEGRSAGFDLCGVFTWRIRYIDSAGAVVSNDVQPSIPRLCPCTGPAAGGTWKNHEAYESCVERASQEFLRARLITWRERKTIVDEAELSSCGRRPGGDDDREASDGHRR